MTETAVALPEPAATLPLVETNQDRLDALSFRGAVVTPAQSRLLADTVARGANRDELRLFIAIAGRTGLDPFTGQIRFLKRWDGALQKEVGSIQTGIDGYRVIAARTNEYDGQDPKEWCGKDGVWTEVWLSDEPPVAARARVYRKGISRPFVAVARYSAYCVIVKSGDRKGEPTTMWKRMDAEQLAKCAEALALRMGFPDECAGIYSDDEMAQADASAVEAPAAAVPVAGVAGLKNRLGVGAPDAEPAPEPTGGEPAPVPEAASGAAPPPTSDDSPLFQSGGEKKGGPVPTDPVRVKDRRTR